MDVFFIEDDELLEKCKTLCDKVIADIYKKESDSEPVDNKNILKAKIKSHGDKLQTFMIKKCLRL